MGRAWIGILALLTTVTTGCSAAAPPSLIRNGGFEAPAGWTMAEGASLDAAVRHSGRYALRVQTSLGVVAEQLVYDVRSTHPLALSGWVRTDNVTPRLGGGYAFVAVYQYDKTGRLARFADALQLSGTHDWTPVRAVLQVAPGVEYVALRLGIHNAAGTAWFDDMNLVAGDTPIPWTEPTSASRRARPFRAALFADLAFPSTGVPTPPAEFRRALRNEGVSCTTLDAASLANPATLNTDAFDLLIVPTGSTFPVTARPALLGFLLKGGRLLCSGGYAFDDLQAPRGHGWQPYTALLAQQMALARDPGRSLAPNGGFEQGDQGWERAPASQCAVVEEAPFAGRRCGKATSASPEGGARWNLTLPVEPGRTYLVGAQMRTRAVQGRGFAFLAVYQYGPDGKILAFTDFAHATGTHNWTHYEHSFEPVAGAVRVQFQTGLYLASGAVWIDDVTCAPAPAEERINAHFGEPGDALTVAPTQLTIFSPDQPLRGARLVPSAFLAAGSRQLDAEHGPSVVAGQIRGYEATAQLRQNARWIPLLETRDAQGRPAGVAGALVTHFAGPFTGGRWAIFGVTNRDIFSGSAGQALLRRTIRLLRCGVRLERLATPYATYRRGETADISLEMTNDSSQPCAIGLQWALSAPLENDAERSLRRDLRVVRLAAGERRTVSFPWRAPADAPDFVIVRVRATLNGELVDAIETGFCVYDAKVISSGRRITYRDNAFDLAPRTGHAPALRATLFGTDTYGNMFWSRSCSPLTWFRDARAMRDAGLHMFENLQFAPPDWSYSEAQWRQFDGIIQLAQRFGLPYMAGLLIGQDVAVDDATLAKQAEMCRRFAARYKNVPGLIYYLDGDFVLTLKDIPDLRRIWNDLLRKRYTTDDALRQAWGAHAPIAPIGSIPVFDATPEGDFEVRARDVADLKVALTRRWVDALCSAIRSEDPIHPITSEYYQRPVGGIDERLSLGQMDVANFGYFDAQPFDITRMLATIKWNDMRAAGKSVNMGEYGVKTHDAWSRASEGGSYHVARTEREQRRLFWYVAHAAWAYDLTKIQNWCWSDDPDNIFPWGMAWQNPLRLKPAGKLLRNLRIFSDQIAHATRTEPVTVVLPDRWRTGVPELAGYSGLMNALQCLLATNVRFDVANLDWVERAAAHPTPARVLVMPFANGLPDRTVDAVLRLADAGWRIYLSGDPSLDEEGRRHPERLERLAGGGARIENPLAVPLTRKDVGAGSIWHSPQTWESLTGHDIFGKEPERVTRLANNLYLSLLPQMGARPELTVTSEGCQWIATDAAIPTGDRARERRLVTAFPLTTERTGPAAVRIRTPRGELDWRAERGWPCAALTNGRGEVLAATGGRTLGASGEAILTGASPWMAVALDERSILRSAALAVALTDGGPFRWKSTATQLGAWIVDWRNGQAVAVTPIPLSHTKDGWSVHCPANDLILLCPPEDRARWLRKLARE